MDTAVMTLADGRREGGIYDMMDDSMMKPAKYDSSSSSSSSDSNTLLYKSFSSAVSGFWHIRMCSTM